MQKKILLLPMAYMLCMALNIKAMEYPFEGDGLLGGVPLNLINNIAQAAQNVGENMERELRAQKRQRDKERKYKKDELLARLKHAASDAECEVLKNEIAHLNAEASKENKRADKLGKAAFDLGAGAFETAQKMLVQEQLGQQEINKAAIHAEGQRQAVVDNGRQWIEAVTDPKNARLLVYTTVGVFGAWHGTKLAANFIQRYMEKIPTIAEETSLVSYKQKLINYATGRTTESAVSDVILEQNLSDKISDIATSLGNTVQNNGYFRHMLFYGPPGTGKTMLAKRLARSSGLEYIYFAGGSALDQLPIEGALSQLTELFEFAKISSKKLMIIIDEAEVLLADRGKNISDKTRKLLNLILGYTGTEQSNFIIIALTNRPEDLDSAFLSRCDEQIEIGVPGVEQRRAILESYVNKLLVSRTIEQPQPSLFARLLGKSNPPKALIIEEDALDNQSLDKIAIELDDFVGRDISKLVISIQSQAYTTPDCRVTKELVDKVVKQKIDQKNIENKFKNNI